ncbi:RNA polymerase sigma factor [Cesiribacter andamanensis]|uniref:RNA polymerase sigma factor sigM n=1 Tax=Cesiribacter andamanensis AMV16 TaxID=1279009 RepID=M7N5A6_9BACT|nr:RNA polymerase sigma factor [Cesiribacter andamanensis]EMR02406.1 RNA polymerase sigma factor sigM [Cesiribacter andamanensis AMV16]
MEPAALSDNHLMLQVKEGKTACLGLLFERHHKPLYAFFYRLTRDAELSEDLTQTVFYRMLRYRHTFLGKGAFTAWMFHMARNILADHWRKNKREGQRDGLAEVENSLQNSYTPATDREEEVGLLQKALERMSAEKRELLELSKFQGLKYKDIADMLNSTENTIRVKVFRAIQELKSLYAQLDEEVQHD